MKTIKTFKSTEDGKRSFINTLKNLDKNNILIYENIVVNVDEKNVKIHISSIDSINKKLSNFINNNQNKEEVGFLKKLINQLITTKLEYNFNLSKYNELNESDKEYIGYVIVDYLDKRIDEIGTFFNMVNNVEYDDYIYDGVDLVYDIQYNIYQIIRDFEKISAIL